MKWSQFRILLVDDEPDITWCFNIVLEDNGFVVDSFNDPLLALSSFKKGLYSLALIDIKMPKMNGFELYREIRKIDDNVKISFMSAFDIPIEDLKAVVPSLNEKAPPIIKKPVLVDDLVSSVKAGLG
ncbi:MAG: response regulator [Nitrosopumilus sp.]|nr:response regulator [Nitrosopumilus sp.]